MWTIKILKRAEKALANMDPQHQKKIVNYLDNLINYGAPQKSGTPLTGKLSGIWRFRVTDYRIICEINEGTITILVLDISDRKEIYR